MPQKHTQHSSATHPMYPELYKCNSRESTFVEFCVDGINLFVENNFIDSLGLGRDSHPDPSALKPSECTTTPSTSLTYLIFKTKNLVSYYIHRHPAIHVRLMNRQMTEKVYLNKSNLIKIQMEAPGTYFLLNIFL